MDVDPDPRYEDRKEVPETARQKAIHGTIRTDAHKWGMWIVTWYTVLHTTVYLYSYALCYVLAEFIIICAGRQNLH